MNPTRPDRRARPAPRGVLCAASCAALWCLCAVVGLAQQAPPRFDGWESMRDAGFVFDPDERPVYGFSVATSVEARAGFDAAQAALDAGDAPAAAAALVSLLRERPNHVVQVGGDSGRWVGAGEWAAWRLMRDIPAEVRAAAAPRELAGNVAQAADWRDVDRLLQLGRDWEGLASANAATLRAARLLAEEGRWARARDAARRGGELAPPGAARDDVARLLAGLPAPVVPEVEPLSLPPDLTPEWETVLTIERLDDWLRNQGELWPGRSGRQRGDYPINPFANPTPNRYEAPMAPVVPVAEGGVVYLSDSLSVDAVDLRSGRLLWHHAGPLESATLDRDRSDLFDLGVYANSGRKLAISPYQVASPALAGELVLATVQVGERQRDLKSFDGVPINWPLPRRRLVALDRRSGEVVWRQERPELAPDAFCNVFDVAGPVQVMGDLVLASGSVTEGAINAYAAAFDRRTGHLLWRTLLCSGQQELTMFNRPFKEHVVSPPLLDGWNLYVCTNLGVVACVDAWSGRVRWLMGYFQTKRGSSQSPHQTPLRPVYWTNHAPVVEGGVLYVTPLDSPFGLALDPATGRELDLPFPAVDRRRDSTGASLVSGERRHHLLGLGDGRIVLSGPLSVACLDGATRRVLWSDPLVLQRDNEIIGPVTAADGKLLVPLLNELLVLDDRTGAELYRSRWLTGTARRVDAAGSVLLLGDSRRIYAALDLEHELTRASRELDDSPGSQLVLAELLLNGDRPEQALARFDEVLDSGDVRLLDRARSGRLEAMLRLARERDTVADWNELLRAAFQDDVLNNHASEALSALNELGAEALLDDWLGVLVRTHGDVPVALGTLTPEGPVPLGMLVSLRALRDDDPGRAVARLQDLILRFPEQPWNGRSLRDEAGARIAALIATHGRELYAAFDRQAAQELLAAEDAEALARIEWRFPNALAVSEARRQRMQSWLDQGLAREVLEELSGLSTGDRLPELRALAADQLGEHAYAARLRGAAAVTGLPMLPRLPGGPATLAVFDLADRDRIGFPAVRGRQTLDASRATRVLGVINGRGLLFMLDTAADGPDQDPLVWDRRLPGQLSYARPRDVDFVADGDRLLARCGNELTALDIDTGDPLWSERLDGVPMDVVHVGGLLLCLLEDRGRFCVEGRTPATGVRALSVDVPEGWLVGGMTDVGGVPTLFARTPDAAVLVPLDLATGTLGAPLSLPRGTQSLVLGMPDSPFALVMGDTASSGQEPPGNSLGTWLGGWDLGTRSERWRASVRGAYVARQDLLWTGAGEVLFIDSAPLSTGRSGDSLELQRFELATGPTGGLGFAADWMPVPSLGQAYAPHVLVTAPGTGELLVVDTSGNMNARPLALDPPPRGELQLLQGRDGFALISEQSSPTPGLDVWVVRGGSEPQRYSIDVELLSLSGRSEAVLVDGAVVIARGGSLAVLRADEAPQASEGGR